MFKDFESELYCDNNGNLRYKYLSIIDTDFIETIYYPDNYSIIDSIALIKFIIKIYSDKKLDVAKNIFLFMKKLNTLGELKYSTQIILYKKKLPEFDQYLLEINKLILFS